MVYPLWRPWVKRQSSSSRRRPCTLVPPPSCQPRLEWLEDRMLPTTFTVTNNTDDPGNPSAGSLRQAIIDANNTPGSNRINFQISNGPPIIFVGTLADSTPL